MALQAKQLKAINWYCTENNLRPELSAFPEYFFTNKETGERTSKSISTLVDWYDADRERVNRQKAAEAREGRNNEA